VFQKLVNDFMDRKTRKLCPCNFWCVCHHIVVVKIFFIRLFFFRNSIRVKYCNETFYSWNFIFCFDLSAENANQEQACVMEVMRYFFDFWLGYWTKSFVFLLWKFWDFRLILEILGEFNITLPCALTFRFSGWTDVPFLFLD